MTVKFYKSSEDPNIIKKDIGDSVLTLNTVKIKDSSNILYPVLELDYDSKIFTATYCYIQEFSRYYFIDNIEVQQQRIFVSCSVDVLYTYKDSILDMYCYVARQSGVGKAVDGVISNPNVNPLLPDNMMPVETKRILSVLGDGNSNAALTFNPVTTSNEGDWVLIVGGGKLRVGG